MSNIECFSGIFERDKVVKMKAMRDEQASLLRVQRSDRGIQNRALHKRKQISQTLSILPPW